MVIHTAGCRKECYCPLGGGQASCVRLQCNIPRCVDAIQESDMCCAVCYSGSVKLVIYRHDTAQVSIVKSYCQIWDWNTGQVRLTFQPIFF